MGYVTELCVSLGGCVLGVGVCTLLRLDPRIMGGGRFLGINGG